MKPMSYSTPALKGSCAHPVSASNKPITLIEANDFVLVFINGACLISDVIADSIRVNVADDRSPASGRKNGRDSAYMVYESPFAFGSILMPVAMTDLFRSSWTPTLWAWAAIHSSVTSDKPWSAKPPPISECEPRNPVMAAPPTIVPGNPGTVLIVGIRLHRLRNARW